MLTAHRYNEKTSSIQRIDFSILGNAEIKNMSALDKNTSGLSKCELYDNSEPQHDGLIDLRMGVTSSDSYCRTCGLGSNYCNGHFGHLTLAQPIFHIGFFDSKTIHDILKCVCTKCSKLLVYKNEDEIMEILTSKKGKNRLQEIKMITKNITHCHKEYSGCGAPVPKIKSEKKKTTVEINIVAEYILPSSQGDEKENEKKINREILTPQLVYNILKNISDRDCLILGIDPSKSRPEDMIHIEFPVPPNPVRPSVRADFMASSTREDHLTIKLADILKANQRLQKHLESNNENQQKYFQDHLSYLQYHVATYYDNESMKLPQSEQKGVVTKSLASRLKGKEGRIRNNLMGKRTDFSARTVITPDPTLSINELGVPLAIAKNITFPEIVTPNNIEWLSKLVKNGREKYPGANFVIPFSSSDMESKSLIDLRYRKEKIDLRYGDIVERHTQTGDIYLLNRQPTLHKLSMMGHRVVVIDNPNCCTFRINPNVVTPYNADFDGDEMNAFIPQSLEAQIELEKIADLKLQIISPQNSAPTIAMKNDQVFGMWNLTNENFNIDYNTVCNLLSPLDLNNFNIPKSKNISGKDVFSFIVPKKINFVKGDIVINNGILEKGTIADAAIGVKKKNSIVQLVWDEYGVDETKKLLDNITRLATNFNLFHGMTFGIGDIFVSKDVQEKNIVMTETKKLQVLHDITEIENTPDLITEELFEKDIKSKLDIIRDDTGKLIIANSAYNNFIILMKSGSNSKCNATNLAQIAGCMGQIDFHGERCKKNYNDRALPYFFKHDDRPKSRGFCENNFSKGLDLPEFVFHLLASRVGLIEQAVRSVTPDTKILILSNQVPIVTEIGLWIDNIIDPIKLSNPNLISTDSNDFELVNVTNLNLTIPTLDSFGNVFWSQITAVNRHGLTNHIYEITTKSGKKVKVPESKSLLVWNNNISAFEEKLTPLIKLGDCVPSTFNLIDPNANLNTNPNKFIQIDESNIFSLDNLSGKILGIFLACGNIESNQIIFNNLANKNLIDIVENYFGLNSISESKSKSKSNVIISSEILSKFFKTFCFDSNGLVKIPDFALIGHYDFIVNLINGFVSSNNSSSFNSNLIQINCPNETFAMSFNFLLCRIGIFSSINISNENTIKINIESNWIGKFKQIIKILINEDKNKLLSNIDFSNSQIQSISNDVVLDEIINIKCIESSNSQWNKLYDITVPSTNNFILFNGMGVYDTSESGYVQRKLIKATEDMMVNYDGTVRNAVGRILQFQYGDSGADTVKQYEYNFKLMEMGNSEITDKYGMNSEEIKKVKDWTKKDNEDFIKLILKIRDNLRNSQIKTNMNYVTMATSYMLPVNLNRIVDSFKSSKSLDSKDSKDSVCIEPKYILNLIQEILEPFNTRLYCLTDKEMKNKNSIKYRDDQIAKTAFGYALSDILSPKKCIFDYKFSKSQLNGIKAEIIKSFNKSIVEPGEMVGIIAAQSLGEPLTQLMLNSLDWQEEIIIYDKNTNKYNLTPIGKFIDEKIDGNPNVIFSGDNLDNNMKDIYYLDTMDKNYFIKSVDEFGCVNWKHIDAITKHLPINADGSNTLIKVTTKTGKSVVATKGKSFLTMKDNLIVPVRGDEINVGDYLPISISDSNYFNSTNGIKNTHLRLKQNSFDLYGQEKNIYLETEEFINSGGKFLNSIKLQTFPDTCLTYSKFNLLMKKLDTTIKWKKSNNLDYSLEMQDYNILHKLAEMNIYMDQIISIEKVQPTNTYVYDFTVEDTKNFIVYNGLCVRDSFHVSGISGKGGANTGVDHIKEIFSLTKNLKEPTMEIYLDKNYRHKKDYANRIASHIKFTCIKDLRTKIESYEDSEPFGPNNFIERDNVGIPFHTFQPNKYSCASSIDGLPWLIRIEFDKEKLLNKEVTLLDIKSQFCFAWEKRYSDIKSMKREKKQLVDKITQLAIASNTDNDDIPTIHIRFDMTNFSQTTIVNFMDMYVDEFKLKGMSDIVDILAGGKAYEERYICFDNPEHIIEKKSEYTITTKGINMEAVKNIIGVDLNRTHCNDIISIYENYGIEAARNYIIKDIINVYTSNGSTTNYQHVQVFGDLMTQMGTLTSIDRHGLNKLDTDPLSRASFEMQHDQLIAAAIFNEVDYMKSVSSRIMAGLCIKGGTGLCDIILDTELLKNSEYTTDIGQLYNKTYNDITSGLQNREIDDDVFIPEI